MLLNLRTWIAFDYLFWFKYEQNLFRGLYSVQIIQSNIQDK